MQTQNYHEEERTGKVGSGLPNIRFLRGPLPQADVGIQATLTHVGIAGLTVREPVLTED